MADKSNDGLTGSKKCSSIDYISHAEHRATLKYRDNANNPVTGTNPVILACKQNKVKTLERLLGNCDKTPCHLSIRGTTILPDDEDETCHNAFYYAVRSGSVELLETLISKWPGNYFAIHTRKLDELLSRAYADLKLKNVPLSEKIQLFVEEELINLRFFCEDPQQDENVENLFIQIGERIELVLQNMSLLNKYYANGEKVDEKFLFIAKFIAQNIHILKRRLKSTYNILPWEEMEFCIVGFVSSHMKQKEINLFYNAILNKNKILAYMKTFSKILEEAKDNLKDINIGTFHILPNLKREKAVAKIVSTCPQLEELYSDYQQIRDIESLEKISRYVNVALSADPKKREGQLIVTRTLQVIGEHFKNTLESPKLSNTTSQLLLQVLPKDTRQIITSLRNSLSHAYSLSKRIEIENNAPDKFFTGIKNDISKIDKVITDILYNNKIRMIRRLLMEIVNSESYADIKEVLGIFSNVDLDRQVLADSVKIIGHDKLEKIINELNNSITDKTIYEKALFTEIESIINFANTKLKNIKTDFVKVVGILEVLAEFKWKKMTENDIRCVKLFANGILQDMFTELESHNLKKIADLVLNIFKSCMSRKHGNLDQVNILFCELVFVFEFQTTDLRWIEEFKRKLNEKMSFIFEHSHTTNFNTRGEHYNNQLELKLSELKNILRNNSLDDSLIETISQYKTNEKLQVILEMLLLDILSIMPDNSKKQRKTKQHFLDNIVPLLTGKWLRDHLAHYNTIVDVLLSDPTILLILNAKKLILEGVKESKKNIDKLFIENLPKLKDNYEKDLTALTVQEKMFDAAKKGNLENLKMYLQKGADINARSINAWTTLHFAASGASLNVVKFVIEQQLCVDVKDVNNQSPLHIAATHGNKIIVDFFIRETDIHVDVVDNAHKTPLHFASANGHNDIVEILVKNHANTSAKDSVGLSPLHYAIYNNHVAIAKFLLEKEDTVDINEAMSGFTPLHIAAESGSLELVIFLLDKGANVNGRSDEGATPLNGAVRNGYLEVVNVLILKGANVNSRFIDGSTPLYIAIANGHEKIANVLLKAGANVNVVDRVCNQTPLHYAARFGYENIVETLLMNKANTDIATNEGVTPAHLAAQGGHSKSDNRTPLVSAIQHYYKEIAAVLIENGASVNEEQGAALLMAVLAGYKDLVKLLLKHNARVDFNVGENATVLHAAAKRGHKEIVNDLLAKGANADARDNHGLTPLYIAASEGHEYVAEVLIANRANVNFVNMEGAPLHRAAAFGHVNVVSVLLRNGAKVDNKDKKKRTALELAVARNHFEVVRLLMGHKPVDMNSKGNDDFTLLHIASQEGNLEVASYLVDKGCSIDARNNAGSKPIHIAAREGHEATVKYFLSKGLSVNELGAANQTVIHYAAMTGQLNVVKFLIMQGANINAKDLNCCTPLHLAAENGYKDVIQVLLQNGAIYNAVTSSCLRPLDIARNQDVIYLLGLIDQLFNSVKRNISLDVETHIRSGAVINSKNANNLTPLHYATWKGYHDVVKILLRNKANSNMVDEKNFTSLHYAVKFSHLEIVKTLLSYGAIYNAVSASGKTPSDLSVDADITSLLKLISDCFEKVEARKTVVIKDLNKIKHIDKVKSVMGARNKENKTLVVVGIQSKFSKVAELKQIFQVDVSAQIHEAYKLLELGNYQRALKMFRSALERRKEIFGPDNPSTLDIQRYIALTLYKQGHYQDALKIFIDNYQKLQDMLGLHNPTTLETRSNIALVLHRQGKYEEALIIFREVYEEQREVLGSNNTETVNTKFHMALVLNRLGHFHEALCINKAVYKARKESLGPYDINTISAQNNIAVVLVSQHKSKEALEIFQQVLKKKETILGINHSDTLRTLSSISTALFAQHKYTEALQTAQKVLNIQKSELPPNHPQVLNSQYALGNIFFAQGKLTLALKAYTECVDQIKVVFGATYPAVSDILQKIEAINVKLRYLGVKSSDVLLHLQKDINVAASRGDLQTVQLLLKDGANSDGRTPLHFAISAGHIDIVNLLIKNGASVTEVTNKGNTPLHTATSKGNKEIAELLLQHVKPKKLNNFVNAKTAYSGSTALHVAAKAGFGELVRSLLKHGAAYKIENRAGETPINISKDQTITNLLTIIAELFQEIVSGNVESINKLRSVTSDDLLAITNARNDQGNTLLQVAIANGKTNVTYTLLEILKTQK
ncbi:uncharacterized protein LOC109544510 isoform X2 [Dendroctonus ponderosae]|uniref:uncharacterized protein LOC109544510 isoform X2 n=1 Tax=Dendroctonus ponderosae TaxID=77166 RepID=UPI002035A4FB|nr:uncharacterized protein LOC109544510 isoform X2 [Dendroctonus ponderosae]